VGQWAVAVLFVFLCKMERATDKKKDVAKKTFDKVKWRKEKYGHKDKVDKWKGQKEENIKRKYFKMLTKNQRGKRRNSENPNMQPIGEKQAPTESNQETDETKDEGQTQPETTKATTTGYKKAKWDFVERQKEAEKKEAKEEKKRKNNEREEKRKEAREKKKERNALMTKKTSKGQPVMAARMQIMLNKIQQMDNT
jgi:hypothetical protein